jgi:DNA-directed RNA polymerase subunit K/omega
MTDRMKLKKIPERFRGRYGFVNVAAARAHQLRKGAKPKINLPTNKAAQIAMTECLEGLIVWDFLVEDTGLLEAQLKRVVNS